MNQYLEALTVRSRHGTADVGDRVLPLARISAALLLRGVAKEEERLRIHVFVYADAGRPLF